MIDLYEYQKQYLSDLPARSIMAADTGTGKTFMALAHYQRHAWGQPLLILAPASKVQTEDWERDVAEYFGDNPPEFVVYSYEKFSRNPSLAQHAKGQRAVWQAFAPRLGGKQWAIIADEVHKIKNPQSNQGKAVYEVGHGASFFAGLSATPLPNGWIDFAGYSKLFGFTKHITHFRERYVDTVNYKGFPEIRGYWREDELKRQWQSISKKLSKAQALDLPPRQFIGVDFKRPKEYTKLILERKAEDGEMIDNPSALAHALRQTLTSEKLSYLNDLIEGTSENMVIFYNYISERDAILKMLKKDHKKRKVFRQDGEKHELPRKEAWSRIEKSITLAHYRSGSTGVEMTYATQVVYFSPTYSYAEYMQSIGRVYRNGQTRHTTFYNFRTPGSIEEDIYECLRNKSDFQSKQWEIR